MLVKKTDKKNSRKSDPGNKEIFKALKRALANSYGAKQAAEILNSDRDIQSRLHIFQNTWKEGLNVGKHNINQLIKEFRKLEGF